MKQYSVGTCVIEGGGDNNEMAAGSLQANSILKTWYCTTQTNSKLWTVQSILLEDFNQLLKAVGLAMLLCDVVTKK